MAQTDNSFLADKVMLRVNNLPDKPDLKILDCYSGYGIVWRHVEQLSGKNPSVLGIEMRDTGFNLPGSNLAYLGSMNLDFYDVIDLDAYGVPFEQVKTIFDRGYKGIIFITFIQSVFGVLPTDLLVELGYTNEMIEKIPTMFYKSGWDKFKLYLAKRGIRKVIHRSKSNYYKW